MADLTQLGYVGVIGILFVVVTVLVSLRLLPTVQEAIAKIGR